MITHNNYPRKMQDTFEVVTTEDTRGMTNEATMLSTKMVRWKDNAKTITANKMNRIV